MAFVSRLRSWLRVQPCSKVVPVIAKRAARLTCEQLEERWTPSAVRFGVIGDYGLSGSGERDVANLVKSWNPDLVITVGDNNYAYGYASTIDGNVGQYYQEFIGNYKGAYGAGSAVNRFFPTLGNHDWGNSYPNPTGADPYLDYFTLPGNERYYELASGPVRFFAVDSDANEPDGISSTSTQARWLQSRLAAATEPWKIVYFHEAPYSSGSHGSHPELQWAFKSWGASAVLAGHDHDYERLSVGGLPYFVNGLGGAEIRSFSTIVAGSQARYNADFGAMRVDASDTQLTFQFITRTGTVVDTYTVSTAAGLPSAPANLTASPATSTQAAVKWTDNATNETGFELERSTDGTAFVQVATLAMNATAYTDVGLTPGGKYFYHVRAVNASGNSAYSNMDDAITPALNAPSQLAASIQSSTQITLTWVDNSLNETMFKVLRSTDGVNFTRVATVGANVTSFADGGLTAGAKYYYKVRAANAVGDSFFSNTVSATLPVGKPAAPTNLTAAAGATGQVALTWTDNSMDETEFRIERSLDGINFTRIARVGANVTSFTDSDLLSGLRYYYRVRASNAGINSGYTNVASVVTA